uniref:Uncharacterized protein n=1 Tax=Rhizophora mucronata TaxID=61149 RepID=A0A2P2LZZ5_RHIMU
MSISYNPSSYRNKVGKRYDGTPSYLYFGLSYRLSKLSSFAFKWTQGQKYKIYRHTCSWFNLSWHLVEHAEQRESMSNKIKSHSHTFI